MTGIVKVEGIRGLFKGNMVNSASSAPGKAFDFFAYAMYKRQGLTLVHISAQPEPFLSLRVTTKALQYIGQKVLTLS